jgi:hypothetical protein
MDEWLQANYVVIILSPIYKMVFQFSKYYNYIFPLTVTIMLSFIYSKYKSSEDDDEHMQNYNLVRKYLLNDSSLAQSKKPIIWIHMVYDINARWWPSFASRNTDDLNQPYQYLTLKSIIDKCGKDFNICLIDDDTFTNIIPGWSVDLSLVANPIKMKIRQLALAKILFHYGGFLLPSSFICFQNLAPLYNTLTDNGKMFVGELVARTDVSDKVDFFPSTKFMGCQKGSPMMFAYIGYLEITASTDFTEESRFTGANGRWCYEKISRGEMNMIPADMLGARDTTGKPVTLDVLMSNNFLNLSDRVQGLYIPADEILKRTAYQWFARLSAKQALETNTTIGKYLLINR